MTFFEIIDLSYCHVSLYDMVIYSYEQTLILSLKQKLTHCFCLHKGQFYCQLLVSIFILVDEARFLVKHVGIVYQEKKIHGSPWTRLKILGNYQQQQKKKQRKLERKIVCGKVKKRFTLNCVENIFNNSNRQIVQWLGRIFSESQLLFLQFEWRTYLLNNWAQGKCLMSYVMYHGWKLLQIQLAVSVFPLLFKISLCSVDKICFLWVFSHWCVGRKQESYKMHLSF